MQNMSKIYKGHSSKITSIPRNCWVTEECPMDGKCRTMEAVYNCCVNSPEPRKIYFGFADGKWKKRYYDHKKSFNEKRYSCEATLSSCVWHLEKTLDETSKPEMVSSEVGKTLLKHLQKVTLMLVRKIRHYYLSKTIRTFF